MSPSTTPAGGELERTDRPRLVDRGPGEPGQLGHPPAHVVAAGVELVALQDRVEHPVVGRGVGAGAGHPLPVAHVLRDVAVDQQVPEEALPLRQSINRFFTRNEAVSMRTRLCIHPVARSWRMPASTIG